eukprot:CAMPEP_0177463320 /NCGR_PEP_ID=MMETSP0369-20130122/16240_1 /TAXON_ID=447022 ORGANISM="Scrippsiella hangoei-like, Strain SHHI-4" /NCGR_SAMPLE_ID=MMETSP0369 /ASSEMBLY_ACC=CAM_ASM_000364 /LENGTH=190 /DNA_ID=CAMNT_0018936975 /DNA_START=426 /DNA_END=994 /DNA_ORIENTATION=+
MAGIDRRVPKEHGSLMQVPEAHLAQEGRLQKLSDKCLCHRLQVAHQLVLPFDRHRFKFEMVSIDRQAEKVQRFQKRKQLCAMNVVRNSDLEREPVGVVVVVCRVLQDYIFYRFQRLQSQSKWDREEQVSLGLHPRATNPREEVAGQRARQPGLVEHAQGGGADLALDSPACGFRQHEGRKVLRGGAATAG